MSSTHTGRRAVITGGATGIGKATALRLAREGAAVIVNYVGEPGDAAEVVQEVESGGGTAVAVEADISVEEDVGELFRRARASLGGPPDLLVNNAGVESPKPLIEMELTDWEKVIGVNLTGAFLCSRDFARALVERGEPGTIVNVSSVHEQIPWPTYSHYCASKAGVKLFTGTIARELAEHGIRVVSVAPGAILTPINNELAEDPEKRAEIIAQIPWGRLGQPEEIAAAVSWLASEEASYVTGTTLFVDGGMTQYPGVKP
ncbi:MAG: glucose 1-dehydrogenase [Thermoleophilaceae bacterium]|nr:glucose 1-dehydrogenase [Thermoleophilaceae bacterium]